MRILCQTVPKSFIKLKIEAIHSLSSIRKVHYVTVEEY